MLKNIKHKPNESLMEYVRHSCNVHNAIPNIQEIKVINAFHDDVTDITTVERVGIKKPKTVAELLAVADECIKVSEAKCHLEKGKIKKKDDDYEVHVTSFQEETSDDRENPSRDRRAQISGVISTSCSPMI